MIQLRLNFDSMYHSPWEVNPNNYDKKEHFSTVPIKVKPEFKEKRMVRESSKNIYLISFSFF